MNTTINISLPTSMYTDMKKALIKRRYTSVSELIREAVRKILYPSPLTVNGFTKEFEDQVLAASKSPRKNDIVLKTDTDIRNYFEHLITPKKVRKIGS